VISEEAKRAANLRVLQRTDSNIVDIVGSATHVVLYEFNADSKAWEKRNVEGV
jgi:mRNA-decapping enzyme 1B